MMKSAPINVQNATLSLILVMLTCASGNVLPKLTGNSRPSATACGSDGDCNRPNFVFLLTDDQDLLLHGETGMQYTKDMMHKSGAFVDNFFANTPVCCPSRATLLSGRYAHHWHAASHANTCMHMNLSYAEFWATNIGVSMQKLGYTTGAFGKITNLEPGMGTPFCNETGVLPIPGFNSTVALCNEMVYYNNTWNVNGTLIETGDAPEDYT